MLFFLQIEHKENRIIYVLLIKHFKVKVLLK